ncbi:hypothetical protein HK105_209312 [Polyrhizophydium stewartii]|uniref:L domain-like protein n=1 Tax=Polyrhizophydium stewartii TaxID=2732419 RepID=A0ABR4MVC1_9FUNG
MSQTSTAPAAECNVLLSTGVITSLSQCCTDFNSHQCEAGHVQYIYVFGDPATLDSRLTAFAALPGLTGLNAAVNPPAGAPAPVPDSIGKLTGLKTLFLRPNSDTSGFSGLPASFINLVNLENLELYNNAFSTSLFDVLSKLPKLTGLTISRNNFNAPIPASIGNMRTLKSLTLKGSGLAGSIPNEMGSLAGLLSLDLTGNQLSGSIPDSFSGLKNLSSLTLASNKLSGPVTAALADFSNLGQIDLSQNQFTGPIPASLAGLKHLNIFDFSNNQLSGPIPNSIVAVKFLRSLTLANNALTALPANFSGIAGADTIDFSNNQLSGSASSLKTLSGVTNVIISHNKLSGSILEACKLMPFKTLYLDMSFNNFEGDMTGCFTDDHRLANLFINDNPNLYGATNFTSSTYLTKCNFANTKVCAQDKKFQDLCQATCIGTPVIGGKSGNSAARAAGSMAGVVLTLLAAVSAAMLVA